MTRSRRDLILSCAAVYLLIVAALFVAICKETNGHFIYALDDAYIHLALSENLAHGHYGINPTEFTSPSSSVIWPLLLIPLAGTAAHAYVPLFWNVFFGTIAAALIGWAVSCWPPQPDPRGNMPWPRQFVTALLLLFVANLPGLTIIGMEHVLQILLSICCAIALMEALSDRPIPTWCLVAAVAAPAVRYEDLSLTVAVCLALAGQRHWRKVWLVLGLSLLPLLALSAFLKSKGLPILPMSVLVKGGAYTGSGPAFRVFRLIFQDIYADISDVTHFPILVFFASFAYLAGRSEIRIRRFVFGGAALLAALQLLVGRFGWFHRYEIYAMIFLTLLLLRVLAEQPRFFFGFFILGLLFCAAPYIRGTEETFKAPQEVYLQHYQMHRFVTEFYHGNYAVNDLGLTSFQRRPGAYVLDIYGLASAEAMRQQEKSPEWLTSVTARHDADLAMIYPDWFPKLPPTWTPLAEMCEPHEVIAIAKQCMVFYSTRPDANATIRADLAQFAKTLPGKVVFQMDPPRGGFGVLTTNPGTVQ